MDVEELGFLECAADFIPHECDQDNPISNGRSEIFGSFRSKQVWFILS